MSPITTLRLHLLPIDLATYDALFDGPAELSQHLSIKVPDVLSEFGIDIFHYTHDKVAEHQSEGPWWLYLFIHRKEQALVGVGGYKGKPDEVGMVEIAYEIYPDYRNQGLATESARGLIKRAFEHPAVEFVQAHTLAEKNASVNLLKKCGMSFVGALDDPELGLLWQWQIQRPLLKKLK